jgi:hypothetical protein
MRRGSRCVACVCAGGVGTGCGEDPALPITHYPLTLTPPLTPPHTTTHTPCRSQHVFVDATAPSSPFQQTYNCIATLDNRKTYNDGYHIQHHFNSRVRRGGGGLGV